MFSIIGIVVVLGCIVAGYLMEHGNIKVLLQPAELIIIGGAAWHVADLQSHTHSEADDERAHWCIWVLEVRHKALHRFLENDL